MNDIFITDEDPTICAETLCDQHLLLQLSTVSKILSTACHTFGVSGSLYGNPLKEYNRIVDWMTENEDNFLWVGLYGKELIQEICSRFEHNANKKEVSVILCCNDLLQMLYFCRAEEVNWDFSPPKVWWVKNPIPLYKEKLAFELKQISCVWTKSFPPYWLKSSGIKLTRKGDRIFKQ